MRRSATLLTVLVIVGALEVLGGGAAGASAGGATHTFTSTQVGTTGSTPQFSMPGDWTMQWSFNCANVGAATIFSVRVGQPPGDATFDAGVDQTGTSGSGTDYYFDHGSFTLGVVTLCTWSITVAPVAPTPSFTPLDLSSAQTGVVGSTQSFQVIGPWTLSWRFACPSAGTASPFSVRIDALTGQSTSDTGPHQTASSGSGTVTYPNSGVFHLAVLSLCTWSITVAGTAPLFTTFVRIDGPTADATAAAELEHQFPPGTCPGTTGERPVVLATDAHFPDALASAYLARTLGTGTLLTPTASLSPATLAAIHEEGITTVDVVGGPLAVSTAVVGQLESTPVDACGGASAGSTDIQVTRIAGATEYTTAEKIAETPPASTVASAAFPGAYTGTNGAGGSGRYNDTAGLASSAPDSPAAVPTAVVATGTGFQDAESASTMAYAEGFPVLLTTPGSLSPQAAAAIGSLAIRQVIVMGGQDAVSNAVASSLEGLGVSVLRVAGATYSGTSVQLADFEAASGASGLGWSGTGSVTVARGTFFSDGLAGAVVAADGPRSPAPEPLVLTLGPSSVGTALARLLHTAGTTGLGGADVSHFQVLGGPLAVTQAAINVMGADL